MIARFFPAIDAHGGGFCVTIESGMSSAPLPSFERPPVIETVLGVQFDPIPGLSNAHLGAFWAEVREQWPTVQQAPLLDPQFERFEEVRRWSVPSIRLEMVKDPACRLQLRSESNDRMLQVQNGRFHYNWLGHDGGPYPSYRAVRPAFEEMWERFTQFLVANKLGPIRANQWEVTYVNHIPRGGVWNQPWEWPGVLKGMLGVDRSPAPNVEFESLGGQWHYEIKPKMGRLHVNVKHGMKTGVEGAEVVVLTLTARGPISGEENPGLGKGLDLGHEVIVRCFHNLTSKEAHQSWGGE